MDAITKTRISTLHPLLRESALELAIKANEAIKNSGFQMRCTSGYRTAKEQADLYALGRTKKGTIITLANAWQSYHNYGLALDFVLLRNDGKAVSWDTNADLDKDRIADWKEIANTYKQAGWEWGGDWKNFRDAPHLQFTYRKSIVFLKVCIELGKSTRETENRIYPIW